MLGLWELRRTYPIRAAISGFVMAALVAGCGSDRREPLPEQAKTPGELKPPNLPKGSQPLAKNVNPNAPRSIKEMQPKD